MTKSKSIVNITKKETQIQLGKCVCTIHERIRIATKTNEWSGLNMYYPPARFGDDMFSGFCVIVLIYIPIHTLRRPYRADKRIIHAGV